MSQPYTSITDCHSGGGAKTDYECYIIKGGEDEVVEWFNNNIASVYHVTCECCGPDFSAIEWESKEQAIEMKTAGYFPMKMEDIKIID